MGRRPYNLYCVSGNVKPCSITHSQTILVKAKYFYAHIAVKRCNGKTRRTQNSTLLLLPVPENSASQSYLSSCDAKWLSNSSLFLNEFTRDAWEQRLLHTLVILKQLQWWWIYIHLLNSTKMQMLFFSQTKLLVPWHFGLYETKTTRWR